MFEVIIGLSAVWMLFVVAFVDVNRGFMNRVLFKFIPLILAPTLAFMMLVSLGYITVAL